MTNRLTYYLSSIPTLLFGIKNWWQLPLLVMGKRPFIVQLNNGLQFQVRSLMDVWIIKETCLDRDYERHGTPLQNHWTVVDIGAGLGDFSIFAAHNHAQNRIIGLEPFPESFELLKQNLSLNKIHHVTAVPIAIGKENGVTQLATTGAAVQHTTSLEDDAQASSPLIKVNTITLETLFDEYAIAQCDFLKLDCEGGEFDILFNCSDETLQKIKYICMEYHDHITAYTHKDLAKFLQSKGFIVQTTVNPVHDYLGFLFAIRQ
ncbi:MAG: FkbM family methyltransferase [Chloroflexota bacterium]